jgi:geranylgeranyl diphosphate synthase type I
MAPESAEAYTQSYLDAIEKELKSAVKRASALESSRLYEMLAYHMGWSDEHGTPAVRGKRIRPLLTVLACLAAGGDWHKALPAAAAVELVHNFSLIHDDIEDASSIRRGRPTVWKKWGIPQAINCGDAMFALAHLEVFRISETVSATIAIKAAELLQSTCLHLTQGQFLDLSFETRKDVCIEDYWHMVDGKTAALIAASTELGALAADVDGQTCQLYREFGHFLGVAFQVQDDWLGIWGDTSLTGKSTYSDLATGKITLPVLYGISHDSRFAEQWGNGRNALDDLPGLVRLLELAGGKEFTEIHEKHFISDALATLDQAKPSNPAGEILKELAQSLLNRRA